MEGNEITEEVAEKQSEDNLNVKKKIFVAGASGSTGKRIVEQLLARGFAVKAGVRDVSKAKTTLSPGNPDLQIVSLSINFFRNFIGNFFELFQLQFNFVNLITGKSGCD